MLAEAAAKARDPWWIIGSAAAALHGAAVGDVKDIDLLMTADDAERCLQGVGLPAEAGTPDERFWSEIYVTWREPPVPVDVMGGFRVAQEGEWRAVLPLTRETILVDGAGLFTPSKAELIDLLRLFGRGKDLERARLLGGNL